MATAMHPIPAYVPHVTGHAPSAWPRLASGVLDLLREAVLVLSRDSRLLGSNRAARSLLREGDGLLLTTVGVVASTPAATSELRRSIERAARGEICRLRVERSDRAPLALLAEPLEASGERVAVIFVVDPEQSRMPSRAALTSRYGLTPAECDVAQRLAAGADLEHIAERFEISLNTVRGHLKQVFSKTGTHRQAELVARLLSET